MFSLLSAILVSTSVLAWVDSAKLEKHRSECAAGKLDYCAGLGKLAVEAGSLEESKKAYEKACSGGFALSCRARGMQAREEGDRQGTLKFLEAACQVHKGECAAIQEYKLALEDEPKLPAMRKACEETGGKECNVLAMRLTNLGRGKEAPAIYQLACEKGNVEACDWGSMFVAPEQAKKMLERGCELGSGSACEKLAGDNQALKEELLRKGCEKGQLDLCSRYGTMLFYQGKKTEAKGELKKACDKGHLGSCKTLQWMEQQK